MASNGKYLKREIFTPLLRNLKWIPGDLWWKSDLKLLLLKWVNFKSILPLLLLNEAYFMYKNLYASADSNVKKISFDLRNKVSQRITRNGSDVHIDIEEQNWVKKLSQKAVEFDPD